jgi:hypothetical protein
MKQQRYSQHTVTSLLTAEAGARAVPKRARARAKAIFILNTVLEFVYSNYAMKGGEYVFRIHYSGYVSGYTAPIGSNTSSNSPFFAHFPS